MPGLEVALLTLSSSYLIAGPGAYFRDMVYGSDSIRSKSIPAQFAGRFAFEPRLLDPVRILFENNSGFDTAEVIAMAVRPSVQSRTSLLANRVETGFLQLDRLLPQQAGF
ncbi:MAG: hypothetical protein TR69_WS6001000241 [candidate division WS6 bacterium OLB20]|uniref:Uncharacterized protein n=1 Tax=candidate division WS6 bacterium OLB20 TaxID=1617426 RepID=A0A136M0E2_9BACT|nr:MAG: hypothetical protein TR69_WS6001000241 [candidate division WS6 bacterium OLB20]